MILLLAHAAHAGDHKPGEVIDSAITADITPEGFTTVSALIPALLPSEITLDALSDDQGYYAYSFSNGDVKIQVTAASITPGNGVLDVSADLLVGVNDTTNPFSLYYSLIWFIEDTCPGYVDPFPVHVATSMALEVVDDGTGTGHKTLDATMGAIDLTYELDDSDIHMDCSIDDINTVLGYFGFSLYDLIIGQLDSYLQDTVQSMGPTLESTIEDAFSAATIEQDLALGSTSAHLLLEPSDVQITPDGLRVVMGGEMDAAAAECVAAYDPGSSLETNTPAPAIAEHPSGVPDGFHAVVNVSDDFANQALYALWRGGLLCYTLDENGPFPLSTALLDGIAGGALGELFPESSPVTLYTRPQHAPTVDYTGSHNVNINLNTLGLDFYADLDGRQSRLVGMDLDGTVGADLTLDPSTGHLGVSVAADSSTITPTVSYNELAPDASASIESGFSGLFDTIVGSMLGSLLGDLGFDLPGYNGIGLTGMQFAANGTDSDWLGVFATLGTVTYTSSSSCGGCGGTDTGVVDTAGDTGSGSSSCGGGCATVPTVPLAAGFVPLAAFVLRRRRA